MGAEQVASAQVQQLDVAQRPKEGRRFDAILHAAEIVFANDGFADQNQSDACDSAIFRNPA